MNSCVYTFRKLTSLSGEVIGRSVGSNTNALLIPSHFQLCSSVTFVAHIVNALVFLVGWILLFDTSCGADIYIKIPIFTVLLLTVEHYPLFNRWPLLTSCYERTNWLPHHREVVLLQFFFSTDFNFIHRWKFPETGRWFGHQVYRTVHSGPWARDPSAQSVGGTVVFLRWWRGICLKHVFLNCCLMYSCVVLFFLGVWFSCALARSKAADCPPEESRCPSSGCHFSQPHGWVCQTGFVLTSFTIQAFLFFIIFDIFLAVNLNVACYRCFQINGPVSRL